MSKIDWDRPLEAYHEDGRVMEITYAQPSGNEQWPLCGVADGKHIFMGPLGVSRSAYGDMPGWDVRNVTEPKADAFDTAFREGSTDIPQWAWDRMKAEYIEKDGMAASFARYVMTKEEALVDPDLIAAREVVCGYHHDKHPESPWHMEMAEQVRSGDRDGGPVMLVAYHAIKRGRELERGEAK